MWNGGSGDDGVSDIEESKIRPRKTKSLSRQHSRTVGRTQQSYQELNRGGRGSRTPPGATQPMGCCPWPPTGPLIHPAVLHPGCGACGRGCLPAATRHAGGDTGWRRGVTHHLPPVQGEVWGTVRGRVCGLVSPIFFHLHLLQNVNDLNQWLSALRKASAPNPGKLADCHPGAFRSGRWTCCLQTERSGEVVGVPQAPLSLSASQQHPTSTWVCCVTLSM